MTIIIAATGPDGTWLGSNGGTICNNNNLVGTTHRQWHRSPDDEWAFAGAGDMTFDCVLTEDPDHLWPEPGEVGVAGLRTLMSSIRERVLAVSGAEVLRRDDDIFPGYGWSPVFAGPGGIWHAFTDLVGFGEAVEGRYLTEGSGSQIATGALSALLAREPSISTEELVRGGLETACRLNVYCGGELNVERLGEAPAALAAVP